MATVREQFVIACADPTSRTAAHARSGGAAEHHQAVLQVMPVEGGHSEVVWVTDVLPHHLAVPVRALMQQGAQAMRETLESADTGG